MNVFTGNIKNTKNKLGLNRNSFVSLQLATITLLNPFSLSRASGVILFIMDIYIELQALIALRSYYLSKDEVFKKIGKFSAKLEKDLETCESRIEFLADLILNPLV